MAVQNVDPQFSAFAAESRTASCNQNISELKVVLFMQLGSQLVVCCCSVAKHGGFGDLEARNWRYLKGVTNLFHPFKILSFVFFLCHKMSSHVRRPLQALYRRLTTVSPARSLTLRG